MALHPFHKDLFKSLRNLDEDGTFDQDKPLRLLMKKVGPNQKVYSFDLSAATDRLPIKLQSQIISLLTGHLKLGLHWENLLINRDYKVPKDAIKKLKLEISEGISDSVTYSVGQPMGALSSFAMLAVTHHIIVQYAHLVSGGEGYFDRYALLGDDIVIADERVA